MNYKKIQVLAVLIFIYWLRPAHAQEAVITSGGDASSSEGTVAYSIGQIVYTTHFGASGSVAQGVQQAFEISVFTGQEDIKGIGLTVSAYPNPTTDFLNLDVENQYNTNLSYQLFDMNGKLLETKKLKGDHTIIGMSHLAPSIYFLKVIQNNKVVKTFKIIYNNLI